MNRGRLQFQCLLIGCLWGQGGLGAASTSTSFKLTGIVSVPNKRGAVIKAVKPLPGGGGVSQEVALGEGERTGDFGVVAIDELRGRVTLGHAGREIELAFEGVTTDQNDSQATTNGQPHAPGHGGGSLQLRGASLTQVLAIYQDLSGRTVLRPQSVPECQVDLRSDRTLVTAEVLKALEVALAERAIRVESYDDKLAIVLSGPDRATLPVLPPVPQRGHGPVSSFVKEQKIPAGALMFSEVGLPQFLEVYQEVSGRTLLRSPLLPAIRVTLRNQTALTRREAMRMCDIMMALNGIMMVPQGDKFVFVVPANHLNKLSALLARLSPAPFALSDAMTPVALGGNPAEPLADAGSINLAGVTLPKAMEAYQTLARRSVQLAPDLPQVRLTLRNQTPLGRGELVYAFDMMLGLRDLKLVPEGNSHFRLVRAVEFDKKLNSR